MQTILKKFTVPGFKNIPTFDLLLIECFGEYIIKDSDEKILFSGRKLRDLELEFDKLIKEAIE